MHIQSTIVHTLGESLEQKYSSKTRHYSSLVALIHLSNIFPMTERLGSNNSESIEDYSKRFVVKLKIGHKQGSLWFPCPRCSSRVLTPDGDAHSRKGSKSRQFFALKMIVTGKWKRWLSITSTDNAFFDVYMRNIVSHHCRKSYSGSLIDVRNSDPYHVTLEAY